MSTSCSASSILVNKQDKCSNDKDNSFTVSNPVVSVNGKSLAAPIRSTGTSVLNQTKRTNLMKQEEIDLGSSPSNTNSEDDTIKKKNEENVDGGQEQVKEYVESKDSSSGKKKIVEAPSISICINSVDEPFESKMEPEISNNGVETALNDDIHGLTTDAIDALKINENYKNGDGHKNVDNKTDLPCSKSSNNEYAKDCVNTDDLKDAKKRSKPLVRSGAVRESSLSPPPNNGDSKMTISGTGTNNNDNHHLTVAYNNNNLSNISGNNSVSSASNNTTTSLSASKNSSIISSDASSPSLSRDSSSENQEMSVADAKCFLAETLKKSLKDRQFLYRIEQEILQFIKDDANESFKMPQISSYNRMLIHKTADYFQLEHSVDHTHTSILLTKNQNTRIPEESFKDMISKDQMDGTDQPKKSILKRDSASLDDSPGSSFDKDKSPDSYLNGSLSDSSRSRSLEEREENYEKVRARIFNQDSNSSSCKNPIQEQQDCMVNGQNNNTATNVTSLPSTTMDNEISQKSSLQNESQLTLEAQCDKNLSTNPISNDIKNEFNDEQSPNDEKNVTGSKNHMSMDDHPGNYSDSKNTGASMMRNKRPANNRGKNSRYLKQSQSLFQYYHPQQSNQYSHNFQTIAHQHQYGTQQYQHHQPQQSYQQQYSHQQYRSAYPYHQRFPNQNSSNHHRSSSSQQQQQFYNSFYHRPNDYAISQQQNQGHSKTNQNPYHAQAHQNNNPRLQASHSQSGLSVSYGRVNPQHQPTSQVFDQQRNNPYLYRFHPGYNQYPVDSSQYSATIPQSLLSNDPFYRQNAYLNQPIQPPLLNNPPVHPHSQTTNVPNQHGLPTTIQPNSPPHQQPFAPKLPMGNNYPMLYGNNSMPLTIQMHPSHHHEHSNNATSQQQAYQLMNPSPYPISMTNLGMTKTQELNSTNNLHEKNSRKIQSSIGQLESVTGGCLIPPEGVGFDRIAQVQYPTTSFKVVNSQPQHPPIQNVCFNLSTSNTGVKNTNSGSMYLNQHQKHYTQGFYSSNKPINNRGGVGGGNPKRGPSNDNQQVSGKIFNNVGKR